MKKRKGNKALDKERLAEDWCFCCKDGGELLICDYKQCLKAYHCHCVGKDESFILSAKSWSCDWHKCSSCCKASRFHCLCCPIAVCNSCASHQHFVHINGKYGMCSHCLKLALLIEQNKDVDSDGEQVDFNSRDTMEGLFKEYYELKKETIGLNSKVLHLAKSRLSMGRNYPSDSDVNVDQYDEVGEKNLTSDDENLDDSEGERQLKKRKRSKRKDSLNRKTGKSSKMEFDGWASKPLMHFLSLIGKKTSESLSQHEVTSIINDYIRSHSLHDSKKKKRILCDANLESIFGRKVVHKNRIKDLLEVHFYENLEESGEEEDERECDSEKETHKGKEKRKREAHKKQTEPSVPQSKFAAIVDKNIRLVYLTRTIIHEMHKLPESFESKITGCFVRVKAHPHDIYQINSHLLIQVTGVKQALNDKKSSDTVLLVSEFPGEIPISTLSDCNFQEEELEDLTRRVNAGILKKPTVVELEKKARILHKDITKHWIGKELKLLKNKIDIANEKGRRQELHELRERRSLLLTPAEQDRLLNNVPSVVPAVEEVESVRDEDNKTDLVESSAPANTSISPRSLPDVDEVKPDQDEDNKTDKIRSSAPLNTSIYPGIIPDVEEVESDFGNDSKIDHAESSGPATTLTRPRSLPGVEEVKSISNKDEKPNLGESSIPGNGETSSLDLLDLEVAKSVHDEDSKIDQGELPAPANTSTCNRNLPGVEQVDSICDEDNKSKLRESPIPSYTQTGPRSLSVNVIPDLEELKFALGEDNKTDKGESPIQEITWSSHGSLPGIEDVEPDCDEGNKTDQVESPAPANTLISLESVPDVKEVKSVWVKDDNTKPERSSITRNAQTSTINIPDLEASNSVRDKDSKTDEGESPPHKTTWSSHSSLPDEIEVAHVHDEDEQTNQEESPMSKFSQTGDTSLPEVEDGAVLQTTLQEFTSKGRHSMGGCSPVEPQLEKTIIFTCSSRTKPNLDACFGKVMSKDISATDVIDLSSDDDDGADRIPRVLVGEPNYEDPQLPAWHISGIAGSKSKTFSLSMLRDWSDLSPYAKKFKVFKENQSEDDAIWLADAIKLAFPRG